MFDRNEFNRQEIEKLRANRSKGLVENRPMALITTMGARSSKQYTIPLMYVPDENRLLIIASNDGAARHPDWYYNLRTHPKATVEVGLDVYEATATIAEGVEHEQLWQMITERYPFFIEHQARTTRQIPIIILNREA